MSKCQDNIDLLALHKSQLVVAKHYKVQNGNLTYK